MRARARSRARDMASNARDTAGLRAGASSRARERPGHEGVSEYKFYIVTGGSDMGCDTALQHSAQRVRHGFFVAIQFFCIATGGLGHGAATGQEAPATRQEGRHHTAPSSP